MNHPPWIFVLRSRWGRDGGKKRNGVLRVGSSKCHLNVAPLLKSMTEIAKSSDKRLHEFRRHAFLDNRAECVADARGEVLDTTGD